MGLGAYPASGPNWLGMLGMHGTYEANIAMHDCDVMICIGARFDDRITGRLDAFSPGSKKIHIDIDPSSINKNVRIDIPIVGDCANVLGDTGPDARAQGLARSGTITGRLVEGHRPLARRNCLRYRPSDDVIMPQYAHRAALCLTRGHDTYITTEVGQHQMWAAQFFRFEEPNRWMTSGGLGTMGYGLPAAIGVQVAHPKSLVIDIAGDASVQMTMQEMSTAVQYRLPVKIFILNNQYMGMVRQWQQLLHGNRLSESYSRRCPISSSSPRPMAATASAAPKPAISTGDPRDDRGQGAGDVRLPRRQSRQLLPDDPLRQGASRDAARRGRSG